MFQNVSGQPQVLQDKFLNSFTVKNRVCISEDALPSVKHIPGFKKVDPKEVLDCKKLVLKRSHALGDILMLIPIVNHLRYERGIEVTVQADFQYQIDEAEFISNDYQMNYSGFDAIVDLFGVPELDHTDPSLLNVPRVDIYKDFLKLDFPVNDWALPIKDEEFPRNVVGIQTGGSTPFKTINLDPVFKSLARDYDIFLIGVDAKRPEKSIFSENVSISKLLAYMRQMKAVICFDSGVLWLSHVSNTPAYVISGPTSGEKITKLHPNKKTNFYNARQDVGCSSPCGEMAGWCSKGYKCMRGIDQKRLIRDIKTFIEEC